MPINRAFQRLEKPRKDGFHVRQKKGEQIYGISKCKPICLWIL